MTMAAQAATIDTERETDARAHVHEVVARSGSSFLWGMRVLPRPRREAMYAVYAFCREVDDIADGNQAPEEKAAQLDGWRREIDLLYDGRPGLPTTRALLGPVAAYDLERDAFLAIIDGMEMDAREAMRGPVFEELELYCARVAGAVGLLSVRIFGAGDERARDVARFLGEALQLTNILRDLMEDADRGRLYLPAELLGAAGIDGHEPKDILAHPNIGEVCNGLAKLAFDRYADAGTAISEYPRRIMRPAVIMMEVYRRVLDRLVARGWARLDEPVSLSKFHKLLIALRYGIF